MHRPSNVDLTKYREPVEKIVLWRGRWLGLDLINVLTLGTVLVPTLVVVIVITKTWGIWVDWLDLIMLLGGSYLCGYGITLGYHRLFTHGSFRAKSWLKRTLGILASLNMQGPLLFWCASHRAHHQHSDREEDPHSPHLSGNGLLNRLGGFIHAHCGWIIFSGNYRYEAKLVRDLYQDPDVRFVDDYYPLWVFLGLAIPAIIGGLWDQSWEGALEGFFWGGLARIFLNHHLTWAINSFGHLFGTQPFDTNDESRNNLFLALLAHGEGWHNNHHAFPQSARHGLEPGQVDASYKVVRFMEKLGWVTDVRTPSDRQQVLKRRKPAVTG